MMPDIWSSRASSAVLFNSPASSFAFSSSYDVALSNAERRPSSLPGILELSPPAFLALLPSDYLAAT